MLIYTNATTWILNPAERPYLSQVFSQIAIHNQVAVLSSFGHVFIPYDSTGIQVTITIFPLYTTTSVTVGGISHSRGAMEQLITLV
jgi:hypothetical protein